MYLLFYLRSCSSSFIKAAGYSIPRLHNGNDRAISYLSSSDLLLDKILSKPTKRDRDHILSPNRKTHFVNHTFWRHFTWRNDQVYSPDSDLVIIGFLQRDPLNITFSVALTIVTSADPLMIDVIHQTKSPGSLPREKSLGVVDHYLSPNSLAPNNTLGT